ncbi:sigma-70 family RNA polymerase sigma factor [Catenulispora pinisilvae]|uniref:sigma-70 family RNA polymerase sigma factor n=1 Tax=Catenulispora pinisilvae TaxID=2705253 RepID=UPI0018920F07|nr:sigma-70 family RNA polymerase sigma factor [Catenulispora pinisilvae]
MLDDRDRPSSGREDLEAALVLHYSRLVRIAYLALPPEGDRHGRVLAAHAIAQRTLSGGAGPGGRPGRWLRRAPQQVDGDSYAILRQAVVNAVLRKAWWPRSLRQPYVWGLRLFPLGGGSQELELDAALRGLSITARMAYVLLALEELDAEEVAELLSGAGARGVPAALERARQLLAEHPAGVLESSEFDPCTLRTRPTDLSRRRRQTRGAAAGGGVVLVALLAIVIGVSGSGSGGADAAVTGAAGADVAHTAVQVADGAWQQSPRLDFGVWPTRGDGSVPAATVGQAVTAWSSQHPDVYKLGAGAADGPPLQPVHALWSGHLDGATVVLLFDSTRLARYTLPDAPSAADPVRLDVVPADGADLTSAGAVVLRSTDAGDRWLVAPWVDTVGVRDLRIPSASAQSAAVSDGVTAAVPKPPASGCGSWPALQLHATAAVGGETFALTDLGGVTGTHLLFTAPPKTDPTQTPREVAAPDAFGTQARVACGLSALAGQDVKQVDTWVFAQQPLPQSQGLASWVCVRADQWAGGGSATSEFLPPAAQAAATVTGTESDGRTCSALGPNVVAQARWRAPDGKVYLLVAGTRHVVKVAVSDSAGTVRQTVSAPEHTAAVALTGAQAAAGSGVGILDTGAQIRPMDDPRQGQ